MTSILYLGVEGIVLARGSRTGSQSKTLKPAQPPHSELLNLITDVIATLPSVVVVLNGWAIVDLGYRNVLGMLPKALASRTVGATMPGNRLHRHVYYHRTRADILRADVRRRDPAGMTIVDASRAAIPFEYVSRAVFVGCAPKKISPELTANVIRLLTDGPNGSEPPET